MLNKRGFLFLTIIYSILLASVSLVKNDELPHFGTNYEDKIYHLIAYAILSFLWYRVFLNKKIKSPIAKTFIVSTIYGTIIEVLQGQLTATRDASAADLAANIIGIVIVALILTIRNKTIVKNL